MHPTAAFRHDDAEFKSQVVRETGFASLFMTTPEGPRVAHTPVHLSDSDTLRFHLARSNALAAHIEGERALAVVNGPDAYISARWYTSENQVPTWNYIAIELEGPVRRLETHELRQLLEALTEDHEAQIANGIPWTIDKMDEKALNALLRGIMGFEMSVETVRETVKLSQNKPPNERNHLIAGLESEGAHEMADIMRKFV